MEPPTCTVLMIVVRTTAAVASEPPPGDEPGPPAAAGGHGHPAGHRPPGQDNGSDGYHPSPGGEDPPRPELSHWRPARRCPGALPAGGWIAALHYDFAWYARAGGPDAGMPVFLAHSLLAFW